MLYTVLHHPYQGFSVRRSDRQRLSYNQRLAPGLKQSISMNDSSTRSSFPPSSRETTLSFTPYKVVSLFFMTKGWPPWPLFLRGPPLQLAPLVGLAKQGLLSSFISGCSEREYLWVWKPRPELAVLLRGAKRLPLGCRECQSWVFSGWVWESALLSDRFQLLREVLMWAGRVRHLREAASASRSGRQVSVRQQLKMLMFSFYLKNIFQSYNVQQ